MHTFTIPTELLPEVQSRLAKLNKRAAKLNVPSVALEIVGTEVKNITQEGGFKAKVDYTTFNIVGEPIKLAGWTFLGVLDHISIPGTVIVKTVPGQEVPEKFRHADIKCDHCTHRRLRNDTFVVRHDDGRLLQVGRKCLGDFLGHDPTSVVSFISKLEKELNELGGVGKDPWKHAQFDVKHLLIETAGLIELFGWVSKSNADFTKTPTSVRLEDMVKPTRCDDVHKQQMALDEIIEQNKERFEKDANDAIEWVKSQPNNNDYMYNLHAIVTAGSVPIKLFGYTCSILAAYYRERVKLNATQDRKVSEWIGAQGDKIELIITLKEYQVIESQWGSTRLYKMETAEGNQIAWFASTKADMELNGTYRIRGTIKKLNEFKGAKQTVLTRVKVLEILVETA